MRKLRIAKEEIKKVLKKKSGKDRWVFILNKIKIAESEMIRTGVTDGGKIVVRGETTYSLKFDKKGLEKVTGKSFTDKEIGNMNKRHAPYVIGVLDVMKEIYPKELGGYVELKDVKKDFDLV